MMLLALLLPAEGMILVLRNNLNREVGVNCEVEGTSPGDYRLVFPSNTYAMDIGFGSNDFTGMRYQCVFAATDKPRTVLEVFVGTGGAGNAPCHCAGAQCPWSITEAGFSCNGYFHAWGN